MSARSKARTRALDLIFAAEARGQAPGDLLAAQIEAGDRPANDYTVSLVEGVARHLARIDELISTYAEGWSLDRMPAVDRNVLRLGVYEVLWADDELFEMYDGCFIYLPRGVPHAFRIRGDTPAKILAITQPAGLLHLYDEVGLPALEHRLPGDDGQSPEVEIPKWIEVSPRYGLEVVGPPIPE